MTACRSDFNVDFYIYFLRRIQKWLTIVEKIDYKDAAKLRRYTSDRAKILPRRVTGTCAYHQRELTTAIKRARAIAILPYTAD